jgi:hypothetical protein
MANLIYMAWGKSVLIFNIFRFPLQSVETERKPLNLQLTTGHTRNAVEI